MMDLKHSLEYTGHLTRCWMNGAHRACWACGGFLSPPLPVAGVPRGALGSLGPPLRQAAAGCRAGPPGVGGGGAHGLPLFTPQPCWFTVSSGRRPSAPPKSCTGCCTSWLSSPPWWVSSWAKPSPPPPTSPSPTPGIPARTLAAGKSPEGPGSRVSLGSPHPLHQPVLTCPLSVVQAWWRCSTTTRKRATRTCTACTAGVASSSSFSTLCR